MAEITYEVFVKTTKKYDEGGTDATVSVQFVGESGSETEWNVLDNFWHDDFEQGNTDTFEVKGKDVGPILMIRIRLKHSGKKKDLWACDNIIVKHGQSTDEFPVYDWVFDEMEVIRGEAFLPHKIQCEAIRKNVEDERKHNFVRFAWLEKAKPGDAAWMLPRFPPSKDLHNVPHQLRMEDARFKHMEDLRDVAKQNLILEKLQAFFSPINELDDYKNLYTHFRIPNDLQPFIEKWHEDEEQGRQMLNGANPFVIERCTTLPEYCKIRDHHVTGLLNSGKTLEQEMTSSRIYIVDYSQMTKTLKRNKQYKTGAPLFCADVTALFYAPGDGRFIPIAIQLEPGVEESIFTPKDEKYDWMLAKMYFRCADTNAHQWVFHFLWGHAIIETVAIAMFRSLSRTHPMYKLCRPHLQHVAVINQYARDVLIFDNSTSNYTRSINGSSFAAKYFEIFNFNDLNLPDMLKRKGIDKDTLQNYHFREDAMLIWDAIEKYVTKIVRIYYKTNEDVVKDNEVQDWVHDLAHEGMAWPDGNTRGCPTSLKNIEELIKFATTAIFGSTVIHSATHNPMFDMYKFIPNAPGGMRLPIHKKGEGSLQRVLDSLPDVTMATILFGSAFVLTELPEEEVYIGEFPMKLFTEPEPKKVLDEFTENLKLVSQNIKNRNKTLDIPYVYLLPERIPTGTTA